MGKLYNVDIVNNKSTNGRGGGIAMSNSDIKLDRVNVLDNYARYNSGGATSGSDQFDESTTEWYNSVFSGNSCLYHGSALAVGDSSILVNLTITQNTTTNSALRGSGNMTLINSIIWGNLVSADKEEDAEIDFGTGTLNLSYTNLSGKIKSINQSNESKIILGDGNIDTDPLFVDPDSGDYHLSDWSPAIGAGTTTGAPITDIDGNPRPNPAGSKPDMGAFENKWGTPHRPPVITEVSDVTINEDESHVDTLSATDPDNDPITYSATSDTNAVTASITDSILTITPNANWNGVANIKAYASDGNSKDSTSFVLTVTSVQDAPAAFEWVSSALDSINITKDNVSSDYTLKWTESVDVDNDTIDYIMYAKIGIYPFQEIYDTTALTLPIPYEEIAESAFEGLPGNAATVRFTVWAHDGIDSVQVSGEDRVLYVNRYEYLSTESEGVPVEFALHDNYPNPFNPTTQIRFDLPEMANVNLIIYNMLGQKIKSFNIQSAPAGYHAVTWNATNDLGLPVSAGIYLYQLQTEGFIKTKKMILLK